MIKKHKITVTLDWASINKDVQDKAYRMARLAKLGVDNTTAADRLESDAGVTWAFGIGDASTLSVRLAGGYDHSFSIGEHRLRANLGIQYLF